MTGGSSIAAARKVVLLHPFDDPKGLHADYVTHDGFELLGVKGAGKTVADLAHISHPLERELGVNVIIAIQAIVWEGLRRCGVTDRISGYGRLLREF